MFIPGAGNLVIKRSVFKNIGLFSEEFGPKGHNLQGGEDLEFIRRALKHGERLMYIPEILQYHQVDKNKLTLNYLIKKAYYRSMAAYQLNDKISLRSHPPVFLQDGCCASDEINLLFPSACPSLLSCKTGLRYGGNTRA